MSLAERGRYEWGAGHPFEFASRYVVAVELWSARGMWASAVALLEFEFDCGPGSFMR